MENETQEVGNHTEQSQEVERDADTEALYESFGMTQQAAKKDVEFPKMDEPTGDDLTMDDETEGTEEETAQQAEKRTFKVKYNGEEKEVGEDEAPSLIQKGMNYDKIQQKLAEQQKELDAFKQKEQEQQQQKEQNAHNELLNNLRQQAEDAGLDPDQVQAYLDNHPMVKQAQAAIQEREAERTKQQQEEAQQAVQQKWNSMYADPRVLAVFPNIVTDSQSLKDGGDGGFYTKEMQDRIARGYDPIDAIMLAHADKFQGITKKATEQKIIKQQQLGGRAHVDANSATPPDEGSLLPVHYGLAEEFGVSLKGIQRQNKLIQSRR